jgi:hypothetical protein
LRVPAALAATGALKKSARPFFDPHSEAVEIRFAGAALQL